MDPGELIESVMIAVLGCCLSLFLSRFGGEVMDRLLSGFVEVGMYDITEIWQTGSQESLINLFYIVCMIPAVLSIVIAFLRTQKKTEYDVAQFSTEPGELY